MKQDYPKWVDLNEQTPKEIIEKANEIRPNDWWYNIADTALQAQQKEFEKALVVQREKIKKWFEQFERTIVFIRDDEQECVTIPLDWKEKFDEAFQK